MPTNLWTMGSNSADAVPRVDEAGGSETMIEIKIRTLDNQTYTLRVDKQVISEILFTTLFLTPVLPKGF